MKRTGPEKPKPDKPQGRSLGDREHHVYVICCPVLELVKIGVTKDRKARFRDIQRQNAAELELHFSIRVRNRAVAFWLEAWLHWFYRYNWDHGEWFRFNIDNTDHIYSVADWIMGPNFNPDAKEAM